jgi:hypothetical protein
MKRVLAILVPVFFAGLALAPAFVHGQEAYEQLTGKTFDSALPRDFYLEGNAIPTQKRNAALLKTPTGARLLVSLIDTTGYSSQIQEKYIGMMIVEGGATVCGQKLAVGSYGFGLVKPKAAGEAATFRLYDQAGKDVASCATKRDDAISRPRPLQVVLAAGQPAKLYLGREWLELK